MRLPPAVEKLPSDSATAMGNSAAGGVSGSTALRLGRVSNLPTVWTNVLAGLVLAGSAVTAPSAIVLLLSLSLFYVGGMFLNDAFDREFDERNRPDRPIPAGDVTAATVFVSGFGFLAMGLILLVWVGYALPNGTGWRAPAAGAVLAAAIVLYDAWHKGNALGPSLMGFCRFLVYITAGLAIATTLPERLLGAAIVCWCYLIGLTYVAKQENLSRFGSIWPLLFLAVPFVYGVPLAASNASALVLYALLLGAVLLALGYLFQFGSLGVPRAIALLIAGISLLDGLFVAGQGQMMLAGAAVGAFVLTLVFQRYIAGT
jgi:4-hydroxybenzoate polyprenyltransferase